jgi:hypothetical protein
MEGGRLMQARPIPIAAAKAIADQYGYDQVVIIARAVGPDGLEHCTTYGVDQRNCDIAARIGDYLKFKVMGWVRASAVDHPSEAA